MATPILSTTGSPGVRPLRQDEIAPALAGLHGPSMCTYAIDAVNRAAGGHGVRVEIDLLRDCVTVLPAPAQPRPGWLLASIRHVARHLRDVRFVTASSGPAAPRARQPDNEPGRRATLLPTGFAESSAQSPPRPIRPTSPRPGASFDAVIAGVSPWVAGPFPLPGSAVSELVSAP